MLLVLMPAVTWAQGVDGDTLKLPTVRILSKIKNDTVLLRWAPTDAVSWQLGNKYGYSIEKYIISRNGERLNIPERQTITSEPIKPLPLEQWE
ncbi:MAG: hypothetical protein RLO81_03080, partial [Fulvivirga sp.]|uniref:hypothetical protein n=1 Tax=Fulvivirga sp. TaxID=1931237 RepID=UPI0032EDFAC2